MARQFRDIVVHPSQELLRHLSGGAFFRGGPDWPHFRLQVYARHCWKRLPRPVDSRPHPAKGDIEAADAGIWCGPVSNHFGHMIADFGMRILASARYDPGLPLIFSLPTGSEAQPPAFFWQIIDHLGVDRRRVMLLRAPTRFARLFVLPQAERRFGGGPGRRHLRAMDRLAARSAPAGRDLDAVFVSRGRWPMGRFAGEAYLDRLLAAAGVTVFHPETVDLDAQLRLYRRARLLIFSEGSALHALQLLGRLSADVAVLERRPGNRMAAASLRPRLRSLRYIGAACGVIYGLTASGQPQEPAGISPLHRARLVAGLRPLGIDLDPLWDARGYAESRDAEIAAWVSYRLETAPHPGERAAIAGRLHAMALPHLAP